MVNLSYPILYPISESEVRLCENNNLFKNPYSLNKGVLAKKISERLDNKLSINDLQNWETIEREPLCKLINSYKICGFPPPTSGGIGLIQIISILNNKKNL